MTNERTRVTLWNLSITIILIVIMIVLYNYVLHDELQIYEPVDNLSVLIM